MVKELKNKSVPELRFREFKGKWNNYRLGDICIKIQDGNYGGSYPKYDEFVKEGIPFLTSKALGGDGILKEEKFDFLPFKKHNELKKAHIKLNDVLFTNRGSNIGTIGFVDKRIDGGNIGPQLTLLRSDLKIVAPLFLKISLDTYSFKKQVNSQDSGSAMNFFGIKATSLFKLNLPFLPEQQKIASFLSVVDNKLQQLTKKKSLLEEYKKGVMQKIFSQELRFKDENGNKYTDWEEKKLGEFCKINKGVQFNKSLLSETGSYPCINGGIEPSGFSEKFNAKPNTITVSEGGNSCGFVNLIRVSFWSGGHCYTIEDIDISVELLYLYNYLKFNQKRIMALRQGSTLPGLPKKDLLKFIIKIPSFSEQKKIGFLIDSLNYKIELVNSQIENTKAFKKGLLQQMFV